MLVFLNTNSDLKSLKIEVEAFTTVGKLMQKAYPDLKRNSDFDEDSEVYIQDQDDDLDKGKTLEQCGIKHGNTLFIGKCKRVSVTIAYVGKVFTIEATPALMLRTLKRKVADHFGMSEEETSDFQFLLNGKAIDDLKVMVGSLVSYQACSVSLVFAPKHDVNGFFEDALESLNQDLDSSEYLSGEIDGMWGIVENGNGPERPISIFWVLGKDLKKYHLKFDLSDYKKIGPTAILWDVETGRPLEQKNWPLWSTRCIQVFRDWGKNCLYLPCDRIAFEGHTDWSTVHSSLVWKSGDSVVKYLREIHQTLN